MPVDPTDPETFDDFEDSENAPSTDRFGVEAPEADAAEQQADVLPRRDTPLLGSRSPEVDPADAAEQARVVELDEDDYR
ncbi:hypothetical protein F0L17_17520 [Streptomyces sp. TRM43335]|uniref:DUF5709 domain-containing protein n=1 Tax=Streptomyces taklimakanensis TaxID=2569853 RepID=A0A6G2BFP6_9ACTN|nr:hypothetical protein [Streptomyces taklimakanensis]MTE20883.1 hypothetical protein [Streptomyces taklimakanensis]